MAFSAFMIDTLLPCSKSLEMREQVLPAMQFVISTIIVDGGCFLSN